MRVNGECFAKSANVASWCGLVHRRSMNDAAGVHRSVDFPSHAIGTWADESAAGLCDSAVGAAAGAGLSGATGGVGTAGGGAAAGEVPQAAIGGDKMSDRARNVDRGSTTARAY